MIKTNLQIIKAMYKAEKYDDYQDVEKLIDNLCNLGQIEWTITSGFSIWRFLRTKDFYKVFSRYIIEKSKEFETAESKESITIEFNLMLIVSCILSTTDKPTVANTFCRQLIKHRAIVTQEMLGYCDIPTMIAIFDSRDMRIQDPVIRNTLSHITQIIEVKDLEIKNAQDQLDVFLQISNS